ncbi:MAG TPA: hypothetical protein VKQ06_09300 [Gammaproteobacteria bacterium]|nr:hypothetical protein [Gammaproteobacteria bacterium]
MQLSTVDRRRFLVATVFLGGSAAALRSSLVWAQAGTAADERTQATMTQLARRLYPHDRLEDAVYAGLLDDALGATAVDPGFVAAIDAAEQALNARRERDFLALGEAEQIAVMREVEQLEFFSVIQTAVRLRLYNHPGFWNLIGYEGSSWQRGGYLNRGAGEIDWLPEAD